MRSYLHWFRENQPRVGKWLVVGKGPSFDRRNEIDPSFRNEHRVLCLNHSCVQFPCDLAHFTDLDAYSACADRLADASVILPWRPHVDNRPGKKDLQDLLRYTPSLRHLCDERRLFTYNSTQASSLPGGKGLPLVTVKYFSAVAAVSLLAIAGVKHVRTLGIDGGKSYSKAFSTSTLLSNGRSSFDVQFDEMRRIARKSKMDLRPFLEPQ